MSSELRFAIFFAILGTLWMAVDSAKYQPIYVVYQKERYTMADVMTYNEKEKQHVLLAFGYDIEIACPKADGDGTILEIVGRSKERAAVQVQCNAPVKPYVKKFPNSYSYSIGYVVYKPNGNFIGKNINNDLPQTENQVVSMVANFDITEYRTSNIWYVLKFGEFIQIEPNQPADETPYDNQMEIYGFNLDSAYSKENQLKLFTNEFGQQPPSTLVKIRLAPEEDFYLENWKKVSRVSLNAAAIWENLLPQWRDLEIFVRKVGRILDDLKIASGTSDILFLPAGKNGIKPVNLYENKQHTVPKYLWKVITTNHITTSSSRLLRFGIILVMLNDPYETPESPLCEDIIVHTGWHHYLNTGEKRKIYACEMTEKNIQQIHNLYIKEHEPLNLHKTIKTSYDHQKETKILLEIDVIRKMQNQGLLKVNKM